MVGTDRQSLRDTRRVLRLSYAFQLSFGLLVWAPVFYTFQRAAGLSDGAIFGIQSWYYLAFCLFEIPTGLFADRWDYRKCLAAGAGVLLLANLVPIATATWAGFLAHWLLIAAARSLVSGAASAYLYEYLSRVRATALYQRAEGNSRAYSLVGKLLVWPLAGPLFAWEPTTVYWLTAVNAAVALGVALALRKLPPRGSRPRRVGLTDAWRSLWRTKTLPLLMAQGTAVFTLVRIVQVNLFQVILGTRGVPVAWHGVVLAAMTAAEVVGAGRSHLLAGRVTPRGAVFGLTVLMAGSLAAIAVADKVFVVVSLVGFSLVAGLVYPVQRALVNDAIGDPDARATLLSIESILDRAVCAGVAVALAGYLGRGELVPFLWQAAAAAVGLVVLVALTLRIHRAPD